MFKVVTALKEIDLGYFKEDLFSDQLQADPPCQAQIFPA
jgi:hypothetical protein